jgi:hypothetical protein
MWIDVSEECIISVFGVENRPIKKPAYSRRLAISFLRNVGSHTEYTALYPRRWQHSCFHNVRQHCPCILVVVVSGIFQHGNLQQEACSRDVTLLGNTRTNHVVPSENLWSLLCWAGTADHNTCLFANSQSPPNYGCIVVLPMPVSRALCVILLSFPRGTCSHCWMLQSACNVSQAVPLHIQSCKQKKSCLIIEIRVLHIFLLNNHTDTENKIWLTGKQIRSLRQFKIGKNTHHTNNSSDDTL